MKKRMVMIFILIAAMLLPGCLSFEGGKETTANPGVLEEQTGTEAPETEESRYDAYYTAEIACLTEYAATGKVTGDEFWPVEHIMHFCIQQDGHGLAITTYPGGLDASGSTYGVLYETADGGKNWNLLDDCFTFSRGQSVFVYMGEVALIAADNYKAGFGTIKISYDRGHTWEWADAFPNLIDYDYEQSGSIIPYIINYNEQAGLITFGWTAWNMGEDYVLINQFDVYGQRFVEELYRHPDFARAPAEEEQSGMIWEGEVARILSENGWKLGRTAVPLSMASDYGVLSASGNTQSRKEDSVSFPFVQMCTRMQANPIAAFQLLAREKLYTHTGGDIRNFVIPLEEYQSDWVQPSLTIPVGAKDYQWDLDHETLIRDIMFLASMNCSAVDMEEWITDEIDLGKPYVYYSPEDGCYYAYFIYYGEASAHVLCMYLRTSEAKGIHLDDVEFQLLSMSYLEAGGAGGGSYKSRVEEAGTLQAAALITAIEQLLTGTSAYATAEIQGDTWDCYASIPAEYTLGDYRVTIDQEIYETYALGVNEDGSGMERCTLITYRIKNN